MKLKLALIQEPAAPNRPEENLARAVRLIGQAAGMGADLALFPEMWSNGYAPPFPSAFDEPFHPDFCREREHWLQSAVKADGSYLKTLREAAARYRIGAVVTCLFSSSRGPQNSAFLLGRDGEILLDYHKVHTCAFSLEALLVPGTDFPVCSFDGIRIGIMICYDREFPESARVLMLKGAELILVPNACAMDPARLNQLSARAFENMTGTAMANYPGTGWGRSCAFSPMVFDENGAYRDNRLFLAGEKDQGIFLVEFDMDAIRKWRKTETWGNAWRRPDAYGSLTDHEIREPFLRKSPKES